MNGQTPEVFFNNLPEIEALPFDLRVSVFGVDKSNKLLTSADISAQHSAVIRAAMEKTAKLFGVSLQVWKEERRLVV